MLTLPAVIQVAHRIREWMEEKLQTYFKRDTECLNHNIWMISCMLIWCCCCWYFVLHVCLFVCCFFFMAFIVHGICPAFVWVACASQDSPSQVYNYGIYLFSLAIKEMKFVRKKTCS